MAARALGLDACNAIYRQLQPSSSEPFADRVLHALNIVPDCPWSDLAGVSSSGPLIVVANHPSGAVDGLVLLSLLQRVRPGVRLLANHLLARVPELADVCFFADPFGGPSAGARSLGGLRAARRWLAGGGALIVFPSGKVAHRRRTDGSYADSPWPATIGRIAIASRAPVVPAFVAGSNRWSFYAAGCIHPTLRTALLPRELLAKRGQTIAIRLGGVTRFEELVRSGEDGAAVTQHLRDLVEALALRHARSGHLVTGRERD
ncbi:MAG: lysophospholipid acyltransferase family protein [Vicinamibacterales bacterium]